MPIIKYTTKIEPQKTIGEIQEKLAPYVTKMQIQYDSGQPSALTFGLMVNENEIGFRLPTKWEPVLKTLKRQKGVPNHLCTQEQATKVAWRLVLLWIEGQIAFIETNMVKPEQVFLPYMADSKGHTLYEKLSNNDFLLTDGK